MKNFGKIFASILMIAALLVTLCVPAMATPAETDTATVTITNLTGNPTVTLYQIVKATYNATGFSGYVSAIPEDKQTAYPITPDAPTFDQIETIWKAVKDGTLTLTSSTTTVADNKATASVAAGTWLAVMTDFGTTIYNPIVVSAYYRDAEGNPITGGTADAKDNYTLTGGTAVAKSSTPNVDKTVSGNKENASVSVGDKLTYTITADLPSYPSNATNKTFYVKDTMGTGLTLLPGSIQVNGIPADSNNEFKDGDKVIAKLWVKDNTFKVVFNYDNLTKSPTVTYDAVVNDDAVVGSTGNDNNVTLVYANDPTKGTTWTDPGTPDEPKPEPVPGDPNSGVTTDTDTETVYTYQVAFKKTGTGDDAQKLAGAKFGIYSNEGCTQLIDIVTTNEQGFAVSSKVAEGTYYVKEIAAPEGYSLNAQVYTIVASKTSATSTATTTKREYTTNISEAKDTTPVGWLLNKVFYAKNPGDGAQVAYLKSETTTTGSVTAGADANNGTVLLEGSIPNTKVSELPSTGGMGTTLFIVGGAALMILAIVLLSANKRRSANK